ncbi:hypothetical protein [Streptomyces sp. NPDC017086]|uniref:hypothetical protein n=1 Tax=Streptomyces sp. NPDC017086 TaxID=3364976 RepID=UPI0037A246EB
MTTAPVEARCDGCKQLRPLFLYEPDCGLHLGASAFTCPWCSIPKQPLLCTPCWSARKEREENDPQLLEEQAVMEKICATNARIDARREADKDACDGIAAATEQAEAAR